jgi:hypothetical protein
MMKGLKFAAASAIFLIPFTYTPSALAWNALTYQEAVYLCNAGNSRACAVKSAYEAQIRSGRGNQWDTRPGLFSTYDLLK